jgi:hypothetical protein
MVKKELDVFLSSDQKEFSRLRNALALKLCAMPFLTCTPLENQGADPLNVLEASLRAVEKSDIYIGIFGRNYSHTAIEEYQRAVECRLPCFIYVKMARRRDPKISEFIEDVLKNQFHFHAFHHSVDLEMQLESDIRRFILDTIIFGLEARRKKKEEARDLIAKEEKNQTRTIESKKLTREVENFLKQGDDINSLIDTSVALQKRLQIELEKKGVLVHPSISFGDLVRIVEKAQILELQDIAALRSISYHRNLLIHQGEIPNSTDMEWILHKSKEILNRLTN